eukprot:364809-Chlamydomonas_euryale.AAC.11
MPRAPCAVLEAGAPCSAASSMWHVQAFTSQDCAEFCAAVPTTLFAGFQHHHAPLPSCMTGRILKALHPGRPSLAIPRRPQAPTTSCAGMRSQQPNVRFYSQSIGLHTSRSLRDLQSCREKSVGTCMAKPSCRLEISSCGVGCPTSGL